jgi:flavin reductase (DIM6/NTAB) family NADH-FMN oxidoreductase RutF
MKKSLGAKNIVYPTPVFLVGTYDKNGKPNIMTVAWGGLCCSKPPCVAISIREATYTYGCIVENQAFTVNIPSEDLAKQADYAGTVSGPNVNKFEESGLTAVKSEFVNAPYVEECPLVLECKVIHKLDLGLHTQFVGEIMDVKADNNVVDEFGVTDIEKVRPMLYAPGNQAYYKIGDCLGKAFSIGKDD